MVILTDPSAIPKDRFTRVWLGVVSQEPLGIELRRIGVNKSKRLPTMG